MKTELVPIEDLTHDPANVRLHSRKNLDAIKASLNRFGQQKPIVIDKEGVVRAGNGTFQAAQELGWENISVVHSELIGAEMTAFAIADNRTAELAEWDEEALARTLEALPSDLVNESSGFDTDEVAEMIEALKEPTEIEEDEIPEEPEEPVTQPGDLWILGDHRLLCGDSTDPLCVGRLMGEEKAQLLHADPPYGMGKEKDGVENDNLYAEKLDAFQMEWWRAWRPYLKDNGSVYIWGNAEELWRLWYSGGLRDCGDIVLRNEIVWSKGVAQGMGGAAGHSYMNETERCLFFMLGQQFLGQLNKEDFPQEYEPLLSWLLEQLELAGMTKGDVNKITGTQMAGHWFSRSQFQPIQQKEYEKIRKQAKGKAFLEDHGHLFGVRFKELEHDGRKPLRDRAAELRDRRSFFDNTHELMTDVWSYSSVHGEERHGHATPKPVAMIARAIRSSAPSSSLVLEPFLGSGTTLIAAEQTGRKCYGMEISPGYCDIIVQRWENLTGKKGHR